MGFVLDAVHVGPADSISFPIPPTGAPFLYPCRSRALTFLPSTTALPVPPRPSGRALPSLQLLVAGL